MPLAKRTLGLMTLWMVIMLALVRSFSGSVVIESSIERVEIYSKACMSIDAECKLTHGKIDLGEDPSSELNFSQHLLADNIHSFITYFDTATTYLLMAAAKSLHSAAPTAAIDHPPKA